MIDFQSQIIMLIIIVPIILFVVFRTTLDRFWKISFLTLIMLESIANFLVFQLKTWYLTSLFLILFSIILIIYVLINSKKYFDTIEVNNNIVNFVINNSFVKNNTRKIGLILFIIFYTVEYLFFDASGLYLSEGNLRINGPLAVCLLLSFSWLIFDLFPETYSDERDFIFVFIHILFLLFVVPRIAISFITDTFGTSTPSIFQRTLVLNLLSKPLVFLLSKLGYTVWYKGESIFFIDLTVNLSRKVVITTGCSGLYSILVFSCAYFSFVLTNRYLSRTESSIFLILGLLIAYFANLIRMVLVILAGHYYGYDALEFVHANIGWLIFTFWFYLFWIFINTYIIDINNYD